MGSHAGKNRALIAFAAFSAGVGVRLVHAAPGDIYPLGALGGRLTGSEGYAVNGSGQVAGYAPIPGIDAPVHAFRYTGIPGSGGAMADLGTLGGTNSFGHAINAGGQVAGYSYTTGDTAERAFRYTGTPGSGGVMHDLGTLGGTSSRGYGINASGEVAGYSHTTGDAAYRAFRYTGTPGSGGAMADLGTLGGANSYAYAINDSGQVTGTSHPTGSGDPPGSGVSHAFLYTGTPGSGGVMHDLGTLGLLHSQGNAINAGGQVAGWSFTPNDGRHAFLYTGTPGLDGRMIDLNVWLDANNPTEGAKWDFEEATGLSDSGWITGTGTYWPDGKIPFASSVRSAYLLDASSLVPEPGSLALLTLAMPVLLRRRARRTKKSGR
jgi:probable HAF family extracellular repeat protein